MLLIAVLLLSSVEASRVITSVITPPSDFDGDLGTIAEYRIGESVVTSKSDLKMDHSLKALASCTRLAGYDGFSNRKINCRYDCKDSEKDEERESLWLWKEKNDCGIVCSFPGELGSTSPRPYTLTDAEELGSSTLKTVEQTSGTEQTA